QLSVADNQLTIDPPSGFVGAFTVQATVTDGIASASRSFTVNVTDMAPVVASIADQVLRHGQAGTTLALNASDADGDPLTYAAQLRIDGLAGLAYQLDQQLNLTSDGNYYTNFQGNGEKWLQGNGGQYFILPDGQLRRWRNTTYSYGVAGLVGTLDPSYYADPSRLWNAQPLAALALSGNQLTITPSANFPGSGTVAVNVSDGFTTTTQTFGLTVTNAAPALTAIANTVLVPTQYAV